MVEGLNHWTFVIASYALSLIGTAMLIAASLRAMRRAETRKDRTREL